VGSSPRQRQRSLRHELLRDPTAVAAAAILGGMLVLALVGPLLSPYDPIAIAPINRLQPPDPRHLLGTDELGRDLLSRVTHGARVSLSVGLMVVGLAGGVGTLVGVTAGYVRGWLDTLLMRVIDMLLAFPGLVLAMAIASTLGPGLTNAMLAVAVVAVPGYARLARAQVLVVREYQYVEATRALGAGSLRIVLRHVLPNCVSPLLVYATMGIGSAILTAAALSFIGLGAQAPTPEWGAMIASGREFLLDQWWYPIAPGAAIFLTVISLNLFGDWLRDVLDPRLRV
jgi:peptide/nickel transport system permease protein